MEKDTEIQGNKIGGAGEGKGEKRGGGKARDMGGHSNQYLCFLSGCIFLLPRV